MKLQTAVPIAVLLCALLLALLMYADRCKCSKWPVLKRVDGSVVVMSELSDGVYKITKMED